MDPLEQYLDRVCRGIAGPRAMRQHIRRELREHLRDAIAEHHAAGLSEDEAIARAIEHFGEPDQVRLELEETHGHRLMAVVIDKAMQWKEHTMKSKWLWTTWAHLAVILVLAAQITFIAMAMILVVPKFRAMVHDGMLVADARDTSGVTAWGLRVLDVVSYFADNGTWIVIVAVALWALFEWRVRSENKSMIRLSVLATIAIGLTVVAALTAAALVLPFMVQVPSMRPATAEMLAIEQRGNIEASVRSLEEALGRKDWNGMTMYATRACNTALRGRFKPVQEPLDEAMRAIPQRDEAGLKAAIQKFHAAYDSLPPPTSQPL